MYPLVARVLREKALSYAKEMDIKDFIASNGWFDRWKSRHEVAFKAIAGEAQSCTLEMTASWKESTPSNAILQSLARQVDAFEI